MYRHEEVKSPLAVYVFDMWRYGQSAYIPSVKQLTYLYQQIALVNQRIEAVGGLPISLQPSDCWLWIYRSGGTKGQQGLALLNAVRNHSGNPEGPGA